jgi:hypothetical protein
MDTTRIRWRRKQSSLIDGREVRGRTEEHGGGGARRSLRPEEANISLLTRLTLRKKLGVRVRFVDVTKPKQISRIRL